METWWLSSSPAPDLWDNCYLAAALQEETTRSLSGLNLSYSLYPDGFCWTDLAIRCCHGGVSAHLEMSSLSFFLTCKENKILILSCLGKPFPNPALAHNPNHLFSTMNRTFFLKHNWPPTATVFFNNLLCFISHFFWFCFLFSLLLPDSFHPPSLIDY